MVSTEDTVEIWEAAREEAIEKVRGRANRSARADSPMADEAEVEKSFCSADQFSKVEIQEKFSFGFGKSENLDCVRIYNS